MSTPTDDVTVDFDAIDAEVAKGKAADAKTAQNAATVEPTVVVDAEVTAKTGEGKVLTPDEGVEKLKKQLAEEKAARIAAEARAAEAAHGEAAARGDVQKSHLEQIQGAIEKANQNKDILKAKYAEAAAIADWATVADLQSQMADNAADLRNLKNGEMRLKNAPPPKPRAPVDPVEAFCAQLSAPAAAWVREHPQFVTDKRQNKLMLRAHEDAIDAGLIVDTPAYFRSVEMTLGLQSPVTGSDGVRPNGRAATVEEDPTADSSATASSGGRQAAPAAAPVSRSGNGAGGRPNVVKLSPDEVEMARMMFGDMKGADGKPVDPLAEYARNKIALKKEGKLS